MFAPLCAFYTLVSAAHTMLLTPEEQAYIVPVAVGSAVWFGVASMVRTRPWWVDRPRLLTAAFALVVGANSIVHLVVTQSPVQTTNVLLAMVGAGVLIADRSVYALTVAGLLGGFALGVAVSPSDPSWVHFGFALGASAVLSMIAYAAQFQALKRRVVAEVERDRTDLARRVQASELLAQESRYRVLVSMAPTAMFVLQGESIQFANRAAATLVGSESPTSLVGQSCECFVAENERTTFRAWLDGRRTEDDPGALGCTLNTVTWPPPRVELTATPISWEGQPATLLLASRLVDPS